MLPLAATVNLGLAGGGGASSGPIGGGFGSGAVGFGGSSSVAQGLRETLTELDNFVAGV